MNTNTVVEKALKKAKQTGTLNLQNLSLQQFPPQIVNFTELTFPDEQWWQCVSLQRIDMTNNELTQIPGETFENERDITLVRFINNKITSIPPQLFTLELLKSIDFTHNQLTQIPVEISQCQSLVELILTDNQITDLPQTINQLQNLESINLQSNNLSYFPNLSHIKKLKFLNVSENKIQHIQPEFLTGLTVLEQLNLMKNQLQHFDGQCIQDCQNLVILQLDQNRLQSLTVPHLPKLDQLSASYGRLQKFENFDNIPNLTAIILNNNKLTLLSRSILMCKGLKTLDLTNNDLGDIPSEIGVLPQLVRINLEGNPLKCIRQSIKSQGAVQLKEYLKSRIQGDLSKLEEEFDPKLKFAMQKIDTWETLLREFCVNNELICRQQNVDIIDERVFQIDLKVLDLQNNNIKVIPPSIGYLRSLTKINLTQNQITELPPQILDLQQNLQSLELKQNKISSFFSHLNPGNLVFHQLQYLDLSINQLTQIPQIITKMPALKTLILAYNQITSFDEFLNKNQPNLETIDISNNKISSISDQIAYCFPKLTYLNLENNNLSQLPTIIGFMELRGLQLEGNPLKLIKRAVIEKGTVQILEFLKSRHTDTNPQGLACQQHKQQIYQQEKQIEDLQNLQEMQINEKYEQQQKQMYPGQSFQQPQQHQQFQQNYQPQQQQYQQQNQQFQQPQQQFQQQQFQQPMQQQQQFVQNNIPQQQFQNQNQFQQQRGMQPSQYQVQQEVQLQQQNQFNQPQQFQQQIPQVQQKVDPAQIQMISQQIQALENEIQDNFQLNNFQKNQKRRELQQLMVKRSELMKQN